MFAEIAALQTLLEGVPLPASKPELIRYAREQERRAPLHLLERLPEREYRSLDEVGETLAPVQPAAKPPVRGADQWRRFGGTGRFPRREAESRGSQLPREESDLPPGGDDYVNPHPSSGAVRHDAPPTNPPQKAIEQQTKTQNEQQERQKEMLGES
ncbi:MAG TPA: DUF2795 domain-containing protein [Gaiellaceae bacterium]|nr:DUF2795 domain-containing protein [Gaiellaceae bacterium]